MRIRSRARRDTTTARLERRPSPSAARLVVPAAVILAALSLMWLLAACGDEGDFPGEWVSVRGEHVVIAARDDGDYDVTFKDPGGDDMTFTLTRDGKKLTYDVPEEDYFIYVTLGGDQITIERIGNIQTYNRVEE